MFLWIGWQRGRSFAAVRCVPSRAAPFAPFLGLVLQVHVRVATLKLHIDLLKLLKVWLGRAHQGKPNQKDLMASRV